MRSFRLALALSVIGASACSLLLDTEALQKKGAAGAGGASGAAGSGGGAGDLDSGRDGGGAACNSDVDCQPADTVDGCTRYECKDNTCLPARAYTGLGVV